MVSNSTGQQTTNMIGNECNLQDEEALCAIDVGRKATFNGTADMKKTWHVTHVAHMDTKRRTVGDTETIMISTRVTAMRGPSDQTAIHPVLLIKGQLLRDLS